MDPNIQRFAQNAQAAKRIMQMDMNGSLNKIKHNRIDSVPLIS